MTRHTVQIAAVRQQPSGFWIITDVFGERYSTKDILYAALADRARILGLTVRIDSGRGWYYSELRHIEPVQEMADAH